MYIYYHFRMDCYLFQCDNCAKTLWPNNVVRKPVVDSIRHLYKNISKIRKGILCSLDKLVLSHLGDPLLSATSTTKTMFTQTHNEYCPECMEGLTRHVNSKNTNNIKF